MDNQDSILSSGQPVGAANALTPGLSPDALARSQRLAQHIARESMHTAAVDPGGKEEAADRAIATRALMYDLAYHAAKTPEVAKIPSGNVEALRAVLDAGGVELVAPQTARQWARLDAEAFVEIRTPVMREDIAMLMASLPSQNYQQALLDNAPDVARTVREINDRVVERTAERKAMSMREPASMTLDERQASPSNAAAGNRIEGLGREIAIDDPETSRLRRQALDAADVSAGAPARSRAEPNIELRSLEHEIIARMSRPELVTHLELQKSAPDQVGTSLQAARLRQERDVERTPSFKAMPPLEDRFNIVQRVTGRDYEFRTDPGKIAFTERWLSMTSSSEIPAVVKGMVDRAEERGWGSLRVRGSQEFQRQVWIAAEARGIKAVGYEPTLADQQAAKTERERIAGERGVTKAEPAQDQKRVQPQATGGSITREAGGEQRQQGAGMTASVAAVMVALEKALVDKGVPIELRDRVRAAAAQEFTHRQARGQATQVKVFDANAPRQMPRAVKPPAQTRRDREQAR